MAEPILAGSLASVIDLAENPPEQPLHSLPTDLQQPLVLYIARVPGSHGSSFCSLYLDNQGLMEVIDVFLTTMKPRQKVVTAQDVQSSLYYMHLDRLEDYGFFHAAGDSNGLSDGEDRSGKPANTAGTGGVRRKPLPSDPIFGSVDCLEPLPEVCSYLQNCSSGPTDSPQAERKLFGQVKAVEHQRMDVKPPLPDRKLLGPRPIHQRFLPDDYPPLHDVPEKQNVSLRKWTEQPAVTTPKLPPRPSFGSKDSAPMVSPRPLRTRFQKTSAVNGGHSRFLYGKPDAHSTSYDSNSEIKDTSNNQRAKNASLSLIRRYNNEQWNVGKISSQRTKTAINGVGEPNHEISIYIMTQGYLRFIDPIDSCAKQALTVTGKSNGLYDSHTLITEAEEQPFFHRHLQLSRYAMCRNEKHRPESTGSTFAYEGTRPSFELPRHSYQSSDSTESHRSLTNGSPELVSGSKKSHVLRSPWGICEFTTGVAGRSFKCKHSYTSSDPRFGSGMHSAQVSELRFNLPSSKALGSTGSKSLEPGTPRETKRSSLFPHQRRRGSSSSFEAQSSHGTGYFASKVELEERLDLSLGQEHAGGGFGGKQAKLGKLIIENEGLQMLDLIVAANLAMWWRVYERFT